MDRIHSDDRQRIVTEIGKAILSHDDRRYDVPHRFLLADYFNSDDLIRKGQPTVNFVAQQLSLSLTYLSSLLRVLTRQNTQQHIHDKLIEKAKKKLSTTDLTVTSRPKPWLAQLPGPGVLLFCFSSYKVP